MKVPNPLLKAESSTFVAQKHSSAKNQKPDFWANL
jgi:hypothetical protein